MARYKIKTSMGFCGTESEYGEVEIPDDADPDTNEDVQQALANAYDTAIEQVEAYYEEIE